jgi:citrate synthase
MSEPHASGLDGIIVAETALSDVDGERGRLTIRGYPVEELVARATFEDVCGLMWAGMWPSGDERDAIAASLADARVSAFGMLREIGTASTAWTAWKRCGRRLATCALMIRRRSSD